MDGVCKLQWMKCVTASRSRIKITKYIIISVILNRSSHIGIETEYTNKEPNKYPELNAIELGFITSSNEIISGEMD